MPLVGVPAGLSAVLLEESQLVVVVTVPVTLTVLPSLLVTVSPGGTT